MDNQTTDQNVKDMKSTINKMLLRQRLIAELLNANQTNEGVKEFRKTLEEKFLSFVNQKSGYKGDSQILVELQNILKELETIAIYPSFHTKRTVAVAGGFSSGKSQFISSLFKDKNLSLPIGIKPTTAIPTYIMNIEKNSNNTNNTTEVLGCSIRGGTINLTQIDPDLQKKLSHDFLKSFGFNLKTIMPNILVSTPMPYQHLCFIDTPGYNPSEIDDGYTNEDRNTAEYFTHTAEAILWLIGTDANGTIPASDLRFLQEINDDKKKIYIIYNKADLKPLEDIKDILDEISDTLEFEGINFCGISAYSSTRRQEIHFIKQNLMDFLNNINNMSEKQIELQKQLSSLKNKYCDEITTEKKHNEEILKHLKSLEIDLYEKAVIQPEQFRFQFWSKEDPIASRISTIRKYFDISNQENRIKEVREIFNEFHHAIDKVFGDLPISYKDKILINLCTKSYYP